MHLHNGGILMKPKIEHPKAFISYAWGNEEYQDKVLSFATDLQSAGIEVLFDKWDLKEGHDTYAYMEQSVNDPTVTNVIILLDPIYEKKANNRDGGVGTETQIISPEIYNKTTQEKFLPVVFKRKENGEVPKPAYLKGLLHFDLSKEDNYNDEYQRLVKRLYGIEIHKKPELGNMPSWVTDDSKIETKTITELQNLKSNPNRISQKDDFLGILESLKQSIIDFCDFKSDNDLDKYIEIQVLRDEFLQILKYSHSISNSHKIISNFFEDLRAKLEDYSAVENKLKCTLVHEMFIYTIAFYLKQADFTSLKHILGKAYYIPKNGERSPEYSFYNFYSYNRSIETIKNTRDNKKYHSGLAQHFIDSFNPLLFSKNELCFADELCYNYSQFGNIPPTWYWFPVTYIYDGEYNTLLKAFSKKLISKEWANEVSKMFGYKDIDEFKTAITQKVDEFNNHPRERIGYNMAFRDAPLIFDYIEVDEIGKYN